MVGLVVFAICFWFFLLSSLVWFVISGLDT